MDKGTSKITPVASVLFIVKFLKFAVEPVRRLANTPEPEIF